MKYENYKKIKNGRGFVILFAVTLSAIFLSVALGITNIAFKEIRFGTNARDTNDAFFAADTGVEFALFLDKAGIICVPPPPSTSCSPPPITISQLGSVGQSCVIVTVDKTTLPTTTIVSKGYNNGGSASGICDPSENAVEREIKVTY